MERNFRFQVKKKRLKEFMVGKKVNQVNGHGWHRSKQNMAQRAQKYVAEQYFQKVLFSLQPIALVSNLYSNFSIISQFYQLERIYLKK